MLSLTACTVDLDRLEVRRDGEVLRLSPTERDLLAYLSARPDEVVSRRQLLTEVWGYAATVRSRTPDTTIGRLRIKIEADPSEPDHLVTVRGGGWSWRARADTDPGLIGRQAELQALAALAEAGTLVTVTGPPGIGRRTLVRALVGDRVAIVPAGGDARAVLAVGANTEPADVAALADLAWLVLEDVSTVTPELEALIAAFVAHDTRVVVTATQRLGLPGERLFAVPPLRPEDARALWEQRVAGWTGDAQALLALLDGHPLGLELAAGRVALLGPERLAARVRADLGVLADRHQGASLQAPLKAAWDGLDDWARTALIRLAPTRSGVDLEAAEALIGELDGPWALDALDDLVRWSWVQAHTGADGQPRFELHGLVALFVEQQAPPEALERARATHRQVFADRVRASWNPQVRRLAPGQVGALLSEVPNLLAAFQSGRDASTHALLLGLAALSQRVPLPSLGAWLEEAAQAETGAQRFELGLLRAEDHWFAGRPSRCLEAVRALQPPDDAARGAAAALEALAMYHLGQDAAETARSALAVPEAPVDAQVRAWIVLDAVGEPDALARALEVLRPHDAPQMQASLVQQATIRAIFRADMVEARRRADEALMLARRADHPYSLASALALAAEVTLALGGVDDTLDDAVNRFERLGQRRLAAHYRATRVRQLLLEGDLARARPRAEDAVTRALRAEAGPARVRCREAAAEAAWLDGDREAAAVHLHQALSLSSAHAGVAAFLRRVTGEAATAEATVPSGRHGAVRVRILEALARGEAVPPPAFPELVSTRVARLLT